MSLKIIHRGHELNQQQLDALVPVLNRRISGEIKNKNFEAECDKALIEAACPAPILSSKELQG